MLVKGGVAWQGGGGVVMEGSYAGAVGGKKEAHGETGQTAGKRGGLDRGGWQPFCILMELLSHGDQHWCFQASYYGSKREQHLLVAGCLPTS